MCLSWSYAVTLTKFTCSLSSVTNSSFSALSCLTSRSLLVVGDNSSNAILASFSEIVARRAFCLPEMVEVFCKRFKLNVFKKYYSCFKTSWLLRLMYFNFSTKITTFIASCRPNTRGMADILFEGTDCHTFVSHVRFLCLPFRMCFGLQLWNMAVLLTLAWQHTRYFMATWT